MDEPSPFCFSPRMTRGWRALDECHAVSLRGAQPSARRGVFLATRTRAPPGERCATSSSPVRCLAPRRWTGEVLNPPGLRWSTATAGRNAGGRAWRAPPGPHAVRYRMRSRRRSSPRDGSVATRPLSGEDERIISSGRGSGDNFFLIPGRRSGEIMGRALRTPPPGRLSPATLPALARWREGSLPQALSPTLPLAGRSKFAERFRGGACDLRRMHPSRSSSLALTTFDLPTKHGPARVWIQ